ncbi:MAG: type II secretion system protein N [Gammaproteobacteria bacterium]
MNTNTHHMTEKHPHWLTYLKRRPDGKRFTQSLPRTINLIILILIGYFLARLVVQLMETAPVESTPIESVIDLQTIPVNSNTGHSETQDIHREQDIAGYHLFGEAPAEIQTEYFEEEIQPVDAPETPLAFTLRGIIADQEASRSHAIIVNKNNNKEEFFRINDSIFNQARLENIYPDRVLLNRNGKLETLFLEQETMTEGLAINLHNKLHEQTVLSNFLTRTLSQDSSSIIKTVEVKPVYRRGNLTGYRIIAVGQPGHDALDYAGLKDGDQISAINGLSFAGGDATSAVQTLESAQAAELEISRNDTTLHISLQTEEGFPAETSDEIDYADSITPEEEIENVFSEQ